MISEQIAPTYPSIWIPSKQTSCPSISISTAVTSKQTDVLISSHVHTTVLTYMCSRTSGIIYQRSSKVGQPFPYVWFETYCKGTMPNNSPPHIKLLRNINLWCSSIWSQGDSRWSIIYNTKGFKFEGKDEINYWISFCISSWVSVCQSTLQISWEGSWGEN